MQCRTAASIKFADAATWMTQGNANRNSERAILPRRCKQRIISMATATTPDMTAMLKDMMGAFKVDTSAMDSSFKTSATLNEKLSGVALTAVEKSTEISSKWTKDTVAKLTDMAKAKSEPADYAKAMTDFATAYSEAASEHMAAFAEVAKKVQMETVELMTAAGKDMSSEAQTAMTKATTEAQAAAKKATTPAK